MLHKWGHANLLDKRLWAKVRFAPNYIFLCRLLSPISFFSKNSYYHHHQEPNLTWRSPSRISAYSFFPNKLIFTYVGDQLNKISAIIYFFPKIHKNLFYLNLILQNLYFTKLIFELDLLSISNLIFTAFVACKNQFRNQIDFLTF